MSQWVCPPAPSTIAKSHFCGFLRKNCNVFSDLLNIISETQHSELNDLQHSQAQALATLGYKGLDNSIDLCTFLSILLTVHHYYAPQIAFAYEPFSHNPVIVTLGLIVPTSLLSCSSPQRFSLMERLKLLQAFGRLRWRSPSVLSPLLEKLVQKAAQRCNIRSREGWNAVPQLHRSPLGSVLMVQHCR